MAQSCLKIVRLNNLKNRVNRRILILRRFTRLLWSRIVACAPRKSRRYLLLSRAATPSPSVSRPQPPPITSLDASGGEAVRRISVHEHDNSHRRSDSDLVSLKISLLGDPEIGKTCFLAKYVGEDKEVEMRILDKGISCTDKMLTMGGARISYSIWELEGAERSRDLIPTACKDSVAILFMFDLTSRCTLNSVISWYQQARMSNQTAIPVMVGTKFDEFIQLPIDLQWTIASQARTYAKALKAKLFFSSASYNINVNKIFKFVTAKLFDLPWTVERNLTIGEPLIDF
uniref:Septum-promoting GTP-binding protein 1 n=1 Tax=Brassica campestris TaxID=3711 RepID=M4ER76_BRACM